MADYGLNTLQLIDAIIEFLNDSPNAARLSQENPIKDKIIEFMSFNGIDKGTVRQVLRLYKLRFGEEDPFKRGIRQSGNHSSQPLLVPYNVNS